MAKFAFYYIHDLSLDYAQHSTPLMQITSIERRMREEKIIRHYTISDFIMLFHRILPNIYKTILK